MGDLGEGEGERIQRVLVGSPTGEAVGGGGVGSLTGDTLNPLTSLLFIRCSWLVKHVGLSDCRWKLDLRTSAGVCCHVRKVCSDDCELKTNQQRVFAKKQHLVKKKKNFFNAFLIKHERDLQNYINNTIEQN